MSRHRHATQGQRQPRCAAALPRRPTFTHRIRVFHAEAARKFCNKSISLYETDEAITLLGQLKDGPAASTSSFEARPPSEAHSRASMSSDTTSTPTRDDSERVAVIRRIRACRATQYYEILGLKRDCTEAEIKKAYRKV